MYLQIDFQQIPCSLRSRRGDFIVNLRGWLVPHDDPFDHVKHVLVAVIHKLECMQGSFAFFLMLQEHVLEVMTDAGSQVMLEVREP